MKILNWFKTNAGKGVISTVLGSFVVIGSVLSVFFAGRDWTDAAIGAGVGIGMIGLIHK